MTSDVVISDSFPRDIGGVIPAYCVTPNQGRVIHRFFDTCPFSPSGRYLACFRMPFEDRRPEAGDVGEVVVVDLEAGTERVVAETAGWEPQLGANVNWGGDDRTLVFNDVAREGWRPEVVRLDWPTGEAQRWPGGVYQVSPCGRYAAACSLEKMRRTQAGYGVMVPDELLARNIGAPEDDGLFIVDLETGERRLVLSLREAVRVIPELRGLSDAELEAWEVYGFHCKWSGDGERLIFTVRRFRNAGEPRWDVLHGEKGAVRFDVLTLNADGSGVCDAVPAVCWERGGHHINFYPDGERLSMNLRDPESDALWLMRVGVDGSGLEAMTDVPGSGHPTVHPDGVHVLTDTYQHEPWTREGMTPLRWIDLQAGTERVLAWIDTRPPGGDDDAVLRVDPHPSWDRSWRWVAFNGVSGGTRRLFVVDLGGLVND
ncbi:MAG: hypothetical protein RLN76_03970 [Phycisphaeraceae bacterium]